MLSYKNQGALMHVYFMRMTLGTSLFNIIRQAHGEALAMENLVWEKIKGRTRDESGFKLGLVDLDL